MDDVNDTRAWNDEPEEGYDTTETDTTRAHLSTIIDGLRKAHAAADSLVNEGEAESDPFIAEPARRWRSEIEDLLGHVYDFT